VTLSLLPVTFYDPFVLIYIIFGLNFMFNLLVVKIEKTFKSIFIIQLQPKQ